MYVCVCHAVTENAVRAAVDGGANTLDELSLRTGCGTSCGSCRDLAQSIIDEVLAAPRRSDVG